MKVIEPSFEVLTDLSDYKGILERMEGIARTCYKSESTGEPEKFIGRIIANGHEAMIEHFVITVRFIHNRGFTHELVRHRLCAFAQESTRYCNYSKDKFGNELTFIEPYWSEPDHYGIDDSREAVWERTMKNIENIYLDWVGSGMPPQAARGILPNDIKTEIVITANLREWRHIFDLRCATAAHPDMWRVMIPLWQELNKIMPVVFCGAGE